MSLYMNLRFCSTALSTGSCMHFCIGPSMDSYAVFHAAGVFRSNVLKSSVPGQISWRLYSSGRMNKDRGAHFEWRKKSSSKSNVSPRTVDEQGRPHRRAKENASVGGQSDSSTKSSCRELPAPDRITSSHYKRRTRVDLKTEQHDKVLNSGVNDAGNQLNQHSTPSRFRSGSRGAQIRESLSGQKYTAYGADSEHSHSSRGERECSNENVQIMEEAAQVLRPGMVLLKNYLTNQEQLEIVNLCRKLGLGPGGFYQPCYRDGARLRLHMMCLGLNWDPVTRKYEDCRPFDGCRPPDIPGDFCDLVIRAIGDVHDLIKKELPVNHPEDILPGMSPNICIVNFYTTSGRLGLHQDRDESRDSLQRGLPVVSLSVGDSAEFLYGDERDIDKAEKVILESGDILIFGGKSRMVFHGVSSIIPNSAPKALTHEAGLRPGRLNLTFRQF